MVRKSPSKRITKQDKPVDEEKLSVTIPYNPRPHQLVIHQNNSRFKVIVAHRRFGKSFCAVNEIIRKAMQCQNKNPQYAFVSPTIKQAKRNVWEYFKYYAKFIPHTKFNEAELKVTFPNGAKIFILGAENYNDVRGMYLDGVVVDEVANMPEEMWVQVLRPALSDRLGWALFIGTPQGDNSFKRLYDAAENRDDWFRMLIPVTETNYLSQKELDAAQEDLGADLYAQEYLCSWSAALKGAFYAELLTQAREDGRIGQAPWDPALPVTTAWDLGLKDKTCIWFAQVKGPSIHIIDYIEGEELFLPDYARLVLNKPYTYKEHLLPHDAVQTSVGQPNSTIQQLRDLGLRCTVLHRSGILDGINLVRTLIPKCYFQEDKCEEGLKALQHYRTEYDSIKGVYKETPRHDWASHAADAFRYLAVGIKTKQQQARPSQPNISKFDPFDDKPKIRNDWDPLADFI